MNEKEFNGLILAELVKIANDVFTNEIEIAPGTYTAAELAKLKDAARCHRRMYLTPCSRLILLSA